MLPSGEGWGELRASSCLGGRDEVLSELLAGNLREVRAYHRGGFRLGGLLVNRPLFPVA